VSSHLVFFFFVCFFVVVFFFRYLLANSEKLKEILPQRDQRLYGKRLLG